MRPIRIFDPLPVGNDYLTKMYFTPFHQYAKDFRASVSVVDSLKDVRGSIVVIHGDRLSPERITQIKNSGNILVVFDINDSSYFSSAYHNCTETDQIDLVFKISGIPKTNFTLDPSIDRNFAITTSEVRYLPDDQWPLFDSLKQQGKIKSLPYVLWEPIIDRTSPVKKFNERTGNVLVRGGNHFWRFILFIRLMQEGLNDPRCMFATEDYFKETMIERFRYCQSCIDEKMATGKSHYDEPHDIQHCKSPATWGTAGEMYGGPAFGRNEFGWWNNRCPASFFWLAKEYERCRGPLNKDALEFALNGKMESLDLFVKDISNAKYYADMKWLNTIYVPPRFWESASLGTVSLLPERTTDQDYYPQIKDGVHYVSFPDDLSNFWHVNQIGEGMWNEISHNVKDLYETHIRGGRYAISTNLLEYILTGIEGVDL